MLSRPEMCKFSIITGPVQWLTATDKIVSKKRNSGHVLIWRSIINPWWKLAIESDATLSNECKWLQSGYGKSADRFNPAFPSIFWKILCLIKLWSTRWWSSKHTHQVYHSKWLSFSCLPSSWGALILVRKCAERAFPWLGVSEWCFSFKNPSLSLTMSQRQTDKVSRLY